MTGKSLSSHIGFIENRALFFNGSKIPHSDLQSFGDSSERYTLNIFYTEKLNDVTAHAEMQAFTSAADYLGGKYLHECSLYVTLEPCVMCAGAIYWSRLKRLVFGASDNKKGFSSIEKKIIHVLETKVRPAVAKDGGDIKFKSFENGVVKVQLQGSCSGCPSSLMTLKQGVQNLLKHYVKEVNSVEAVQ